MAPLLKMPHLKIGSLPNSNLTFTREFCLDLPPEVNSNGLWRKRFDYRQWLEYSIPLVEIQLVSFMSTMVLLHFFLKRFGFSKLSCQIITGLLFGCSWAGWKVGQSEIFTEQSEDVLGLLAYVGFTLYMFLSAVKMDVTMAVRTGKKAFIIGFTTLLVPLIGGLVLTISFFSKEMSNEEMNYSALMVSLHSLTSFPVIASLLTELRILHSELGRLGLSSALVCDMLSIASTSIFKIVINYKHNPAESLFQLAGILFYLALLFFVLRPAMFFIIKQTPEGKPVRRSYIQAIIFLALLSSICGIWMGQSVIFGPYILGLFIPDGAPLGSTLAEKVECLVSDVFTPILAVTCALRVDLLKLSASFSTSFSTSSFSKLNVVIVFFTLPVKLISCFISSWHCNLPLRDSFAMSFILSSKGLVELAFYTMLRDDQSVDDGLFGFFTLMVLVVATLFPMVVRNLYDPSLKYAGYQNRNIMALNLKSELKLLACVHRNENIYGLIHLLNISCPTIDSPLAVYVFHLIELIGRTTPIFISHRLQNTALKLINDDQISSYSDNIVLSFEHFSKDNPNTVYTECFTGISPIKFMHDDICTLALNKMISFIILPFHRTWTVDGFIDQEDNSIRSLNSSVLECAPCSVGIFVDRGHLGRAASMASTGIKDYKYSVSMIFLGGEDDREALSFAKRMVKDSRVELTVIRIVGNVRKEVRSSNNWEEMLDSEVIREFKLQSCLGVENDDENGGFSMRFVEEMSNDGPETALKVRKLVNEFDLIIVGRRNGLESAETSGLSEWNEFPELGILGDLIASADINTTTSVLVIQKQISRLQI